MPECDVVVVGAGPNGLAAAVTLARAGLSVRVYEAAATIGGGARTSELTAPGYRHDVCSAVHPMAFASPFFRAFELRRRVPFVVPEVSYAHPLDGGVAGLAHLDLEATVAALGRDGAAWRNLFGPLVRQVDAVTRFSGSNLVGIPADPILTARFGMRVLEQGTPLWNARFRESVAPAMISGVGAHGIGRMPGLATSGVAMALATHAHARGWPIPIGGSQAIVDAMAADLLAHGGSITCDTTVTDLRELPSARAVLLDVTPRALARMAGNTLPRGYARALADFRYGDGVAKIDLVLSGPIPWTNPEIARTATVHIGGPRGEIARAENDVANGRHPDSPYLLLSQPSAFDASRAPDGKHIVWAYSHVPAGSTLDRSEVMLLQLERFAPGVRDLVEHISYRSARDVGEYNANYVDGDINSGAVTVRQLIKRPVVSTDPWRTPLPGVYLCSQSTPPGTGVHGLSGLYAARSALRHEFGIRGLPALGVGA